VQWRRATCGGLRRGTTPKVGRWSLQADWGSELGLGAHRWPVSALRGRLEAYSGAQGAIRGAVELRHRPRFEPK
jgi:hypothetical protein